MTFRTYLVGGAVRDGLLGVRTKDYDYSVVVEGADTVEAAYAEMVDDLRERGFTIFAEYPEFTRVAAKFPKGHEYEKHPGDFVLARKEGPYTDHRHPDWVTIGTLEDDLARRDFTINALALDPDTGEIIDLFGGREDLDARVIRAVGKPIDRLIEDPLRVFRAIRFSVTKNFTIDPLLRIAMHDPMLIELMDATSTERIREEFAKAFKADTLKTMTVMVRDFPVLAEFVFNKRGLWTKPTTEAR